MMGKLDDAEKLLNQGNYRGAISLCEELRKDCPHEESILLILAWAYYDSGNKVQAVDCLETLLALELKRKVFTGFAFDELVRIYKEEKNFSRLVEICERTVAVQPDDSGLLLQLGDAYFRAGIFPEACCTFEKLIGREDDNPYFYCLYGESLFAAGAIPECESAYGRAAEIDPDDADNYYFKLAMLFQKVQNAKESKRLLLKCIDRKPAKSIYHSSLGDTLIDEKKTEEAWAAYKRAIECDVANTAAYYNRLGNSLMRAKYFSEAEKAYLAALNFEAANPYYLNLVRAYEAQGLFSQAAEIRKLVKD
jgi:tetratricopeptide (TPR) repeat protein